MKSEQEQKSMPKGAKFFGSGIAKGMRVTMKNLLGRTITTSYPEHKLTVSKRTRGNEFVWYPAKCTGCATCAKSCPQGNIEIITSRGTGNSYDVEKFEIDTGRCMFCGLCVESCPYDALCMGRAYELAQYRRGDLILDKDALLETETRKPSGYFRPKIEKTLPAQTLLLDRAGRKQKKGSSK
ncbi:MAG: NADH-quinone oxidoreductase subunit I [Dehalococcoidia bacterium]|nr:NADH-quinone oxidoreductase subunit I [Dehalococcoidia bacterium]